MTNSLLPMGDWSVFDCSNCKNRIFIWLNWFNPYQHVTSAYHLLISPDILSLLKPSRSTCSHYTTYQHHLQLSQWGGSCLLQSLIWNQPSSTFPIRMGQCSEHLMILFIAGSVAKVWSRTLVQTQTFWTECKVQFEFRFRFRVQKISGEQVQTKLNLQTFSHWERTFPLFLTFFFCNFLVQNYCNQ